MSSIEREKNCNRWHLPAILTSSLTFPCLPPSWEHKSTIPVCSIQNASACCIHPLPPSSLPQPKKKKESLDCTFYTWPTPSHSFKMIIPLFTAVYWSLQLFLHSLPLFPSWLPLLFFLTTLFWGQVLYKKINKTRLIIHYYVIQMYFLNLDIIDI